MPRKRTSSNRPASTAICGNIDTERMVKSSNPRPQKLTRDKAYAAVIANSNDRTTTTVEISSELPRLRRKVPVVITEIV